MSKAVKYNVLTALVVLLGINAAAVVAPQMELLMENNITSTGTIDQTGWWYAGDYVPGVGGTTGANFNAESRAIAFGPTTGGTAMTDALSKGLESFTISAWIKADSLAGFYNNGTVFANTTTPNANGIHLYAGSAYHGAMLLRVDGVYRWGPSSLPYKVVGDWQFIAITYDGTKTTQNMVWYWAENGELKSLVTDLNAGAVADSSTAPIVIGGGNASPIVRLNGGVDDFRMWGAKTGTSGVLTANDIAVVMNTHTTIPEPATIALLGFGALSLIRRRK